LEWGSTIYLRKLRHLLPLLFGNILFYSNFTKIVLHYLSHLLVGKIILPCFLDHLLPQIALWFFYSSFSKKNPLFVTYFIQQIKFLDWSSTLLYGKNTTAHLKQYFTICCLFYSGIYYCLLRQRLHTKILHYSSLLLFRKIIQCFFLITIFKILH
jgi:hypothetical protein